MGWAIGIPVAILAVAGLAASVALSGLVRIEALDALLEQYPFVSTISVKIAVLLLFAGNALALYVLVFKKIWNLPIFLTGASMMLMIYAASCVIGQVNPYRLWSDMLCGSGRLRCRSPLHEASGKYGCVSRPGCDRLQERCGFLYQGSGFEDEGKRSSDIAHNC